MKSVINKIRVALMVGVVSAAVPFSVMADRACENEIISNEVINDSVTVVPGAWCIVDDSEGPVVIKGNFTANGGAGEILIGGEDTTVKGNVTITHSEAGSTVAVKNGITVLGNIKIANNKDGEFIGLVGGARAGLPGMNIHGKVTIMDNSAKTLLAVAEKDPPGGENIQVGGDVLFMRNNAGFSGVIDVNAKNVKYSNNVADKHLIVVNTLINTIVTGNLGSDDHPYTNAPTPIDNEIGIGVVASNIGGNLIFNNNVARSSLPLDTYFVFYINNVDGQINCGNNEFRDAFIYALVNYNKINCDDALWLGF